MKPPSEVQTAADDSIRLAGPDDVPALARIYREAAETFGPSVYSATQVRAWAAFGADTPEFREYVLGAKTWVAECAGRPLAFCGIDDRGELRSFYVTPERTRRGLGTRLLAHNLADAAARGLTTLHTWATPFSRPVFERAGFRLAETVRMPYRGVEFERYRYVRG